MALLSRGDAGWNSTVDITSLQSMLHKTNEQSSTRVTALIVRFVICLLVNERFGAGFP